MNNPQIDIGRIGEMIKCDYNNTNSHCKILKEEGEIDSTSQFGYQITTKGSKSFYDKKYLNSAEREHREVSTWFIGILTGIIGLFILLLKYLEVF